jgi:hypothetical protein
MSLARYFIGLGFLIKLCLIVTVFCVSLPEVMRLDGKTCVNKNELHTRPVCHPITKMCVSLQTLLCQAGLAGVECASSFPFFFYFLVSSFQHGGLYEAECFQAQRLVV